MSNVHADRASLRAIGLKLRSYRKREHRCFELAWMTILDATDSDWRLVHGTVDGGTGQRFPYAWLRKGTTVYDPVRNEIWDAYTYVVKADGREVAVYTLQEAGKAGWAYKHCGPWIAELEHAA
jgi:hypothetical protein